MRTRHALAILPLLALAAGCAESPANPYAPHAVPATSEAATEATSTTSSAPMDHSGHQASALPTSIPTATTSRFATGQAVTITADHMPGMKGAQGTVAGVYDTTTYAVTYTPTTGGPAVKDHQWVVAQEVTGAKDPAAVGDQVTITANHMPGMKGAKGTVTQVVTTPVYAVNYTPTDGGAMVMNHLWVTQDELVAR